jgi:hypothetical protein
MDRWMDGCLAARLPGRVLAEAAALLGVLGRCVSAASAPKRQHCPQNVPDCWPSVGRLSPSAQPQLARCVEPARNRLQARSSFASDTLPAFHPLAAAGTLRRVDAQVRGCGGPDAAVPLLPQPRAERHLQVGAAGSWELGLAAHFERKRLLRVTGLGRTQQSWRAALAPQSKPPWVQLKCAPSLPLPVARACWSAGCCAESPTPCPRPPAFPAAPRCLPP